jgi:hypothetical protein
MEGIGWYNPHISQFLTDCSFKGTVPPDFLPLVFFFKQLLLAPVDKPSNDFDFFRIFAEIFDYFVLCRCQRHRQCMHCRFH